LLKGIYPFRANIYQKLPILGLSIHIFKATTEKFGVRVQIWETLLHAKFGKNRLWGYTPLGQIFTKKIPILAIFGAVSPHF